jgi:peptidoglycan/xylan/chitin deacetylase (PgdA/CDA1 family)
MGVRRLEFREMHWQIPAYYSGLAPFRKSFETGNPILTYHKLGPRPAQVRLKGLYLSEALFSRQLQELRSAGFASGELVSAAGPCVGRRIVITFDDGYVNVLRHGLGPLAEVRFTAVQFLVAERLGKWNDWDLGRGEASEPMMDVAEVGDWLAAGHEIGSHTLTHPCLTKLPRAKAQEEITASRKQLQDLFGRPIDHFCYPYGDWNAEVREMVAAAGYETACTTDTGVNTALDSPFALKRFTARYASRSLKTFWGRLSRGFRPRKLKPG